MLTVKDILFNSSKKRIHKNILKFFRVAISRHTKQLQNGHFGECIINITSVYIEIDYQRNKILS